MIEPHDEPILKHLIDIECELRDRKPYNFKLNFHFSPNEYFSNTVLSKTYEFKVEIDPSDPYVFEAPETECSKGCDIKWKSPDKDVTKLKLCDESFFNFFTTIDFAGKDRHSFTAQNEAELAIDYEIGYVFKEKVIPRAILYYMGEICDSNGQSDSEEDEDQEIDDQDGEYQACDVNAENLNKN